MILIQIKIDKNNKNIFNLFSAARPAGDTDDWFKGEVVERHEKSGNFIQAAPNNKEEDAGLAYGSTVREIESAIELIGPQKKFRNFFSATGFTFHFPVTVDITPDPKVFWAKLANSPAYSHNEVELEDYFVFVKKYQSEFARMNDVICQIAENSKKILTPEVNLPCFARYYIFLSNVFILFRPLFLNLFLC